jgi:hypothetical protein
MALTVHETQESRSVSESNGRSTGTRRFLVYDDASEITHPGPLRDQFGSGTLPDVGDQFPNSPALYAVSYSIRHVPDQRGLWEVEYQYESTEPGQYQPQEIGYTEFSIEYSAELRDMWRANPGLSFPSFGSPGATNRLCAGRAIDVAGVPMSVLHRFSNLTITETVAASTLPDRSLVIRLARGRRNNVEFYGAPAGQVLYLGATASRIALDKFQIVHKFAQDAHYHMIQSPVRGPTGQVANLILDSSGLLYAGDVFWVQPFGEFIEMNSISENF